MRDPEHYKKCVKAALDLVLFPPESDKAKTGFVILSSAPEGIKSFVVDMAKMVQEHREKMKKSGVSLPPGYGSMEKLKADLKAVAQHGGFNPLYVDDFCRAHGFDGWKLPSGELIKNPMAIFTNYCKKREQSEPDFCL